MVDKTAQLVDLPDEEPVRPAICSPKLIFLLLLASYFVFQNVYNGYMHPIIPASDPPKIDEEANAKIIWDRLSGYLAVAVVFFFIFYFMKRANDKYDEQEEEQRKKKEEEKLAEEQKKISEREKRMFQKQEQEEKQYQERIKKCQQQEGFKEQ